MQVLLPRESWGLTKETIMSSLEVLSVDELQVLFSEKFSLAAKSFFECAMILNHIEEKYGIDMSHIGEKMARCLRKIAYGQMIPELMVYCGTDDDLLCRASCLTIKDQQSLVNSEGFEFVEGDDKRIVDPRTAERWQRQQLFARDHIREPHEQKQWLKGRTMAKPRRTRLVVTSSDSVEQDELTSRITVGVTPEWEGIIQEMMKTNGWPKWYAATRFLISLGRGS